MLTSNETVERLLHEHDDNNSTKDARKMQLYCITQRVQRRLTRTTLNIVFADRLFAPVQTPRIRRRAREAVSTSNYTCKFALIDASVHPATRGIGVDSTVFDPSRAIISGNYELSASPLVHIRSCRDNAADSAGYMYLPDTGDVRPMYRECACCVGSRRLSFNAPKSAVRLRDTEQLNRTPDV